jgi:hypothetical protein
MTQSGVRVDDHEQVILEADPPHRLSLHLETPYVELVQVQG